MGRGQIGPAVHQFQHLLGGRSVVGLSERQLLRLYLDRRDEVAFEAIVSRHGPMVLGVCRRILADTRDVEDAFQATFLILARKGGTLGEKVPVGHWLHGVAHRVALRARTSSWRRRSREQNGTPPEVATVDDPARHDLGAVIDEELARLPSKYRAPIILCYLEGLTHEEAGQELGWPVGTVKGRLARARDLLKSRLARRGVAPSSGPAVIGLAPITAAVVSSSLVKSTIKAAMAGQTAGMVPVAVASLVTGSLTTMFLLKMKAVGAVLLVLGTGAAVMAYQASKEPGDVPGQDQAKPGPAKPGPTKTEVKPSSSSEVADWDAGWPSVTVQDDPSPGSKAIHAKLEARIPMSFPHDTPLEDIMRYLETATQDQAAGFPNGIPIYVDPQGLQDADKTMVSPVSITLEGIPLRITLELLLRQLGMTYRVKDGLLIIESESIDHQRTPLNILEGKAMRGELTREQYKQLIEMLKLRNEVESLVNLPSEGGGGISKSFTKPK